MIENTWYWLVTYYKDSNFYKPQRLSTFHNGTPSCMTRTGSFTLCSNKRHFNYYSNAKREADRLNMKSLQIYNKRMDRLKAEHDRLERKMIDLDSKFPDPDECKELK